MKRSPEKSTEEIAEEERPHPGTGWKHKAVLTVWAVGPLVAFPFALRQAIKAGRVEKKVVVTTVVGYLLTGQGITLGYHRLATHDAFKTHPLVKGAILALGSAAAQGPVITWADNHRRHHIFADQIGDPHSPNAEFGEGWKETLKGFAHAHIFWLFEDPPEDIGKYTKRLHDDKVVVFIDKTFVGWVTAGLVVPKLIGGWSGFLWGGLIRMFLVNHATFAVNSICHMYGKRRFETIDESRNNLFIAMLTGGEGNHNNHHANAKAAYHGLAWNEYDLTGYVIRAMKLVGVAWDVHEMTPEDIKERKALLERQTAKAIAAQKVAALAEHEHASQNGHAVTSNGTESHAADAVDEEERDLVGATSVMDAPFQTK